MTIKLMKTLTAVATGLLLSAPGWAESVSFADPTGDDNGPGNYLYPTDPVYLQGSFDLTALTVEHKGKNVTFEAEVNSKLKDPRGMGGGFAVQMIFIFIDTDGVEGSGHTEGLPGTNVQFDSKHAWDKVVVLSPQPKSRVDSEARSKAEGVRGDIVVPGKTRGRGKGVSGKVKLEDLGGGDPATWGYQVVVQSNEGFPDKTDLLTRKVNEYEGQHRFGGGSDYDCDPHVMDLLAGDGDGSDDEIQAQHDMLAFECDDEGNAVKAATLTMVRK